MTRPGSVPSSLPALAAALASGDLDLYDYLDHLEERFAAREPEVLAFVEEDGRFERLRREAHQLLARFPEPAARPALFGVPVGVKDVFRVDGFPTRAGSRLPPEELAGEEAESVTRLREAGVLLLGKTVTTEFATFAPGPTRNPWHPRHTPGGSSSGSAAAVGAGLAPLTLGTQTIGSVGRPASFCGVVGFKPSYERISRAGVIPVSPALDHVGCFTGDAAGAALAASLLCAGWSHAAPAFPPVLGVPEGPYLERASPEGLARFRAACESLSAHGLTIRPVAAFADFAAVEARHRQLFDGEMAATHREWFARHQDLYRAKTVEIIRRGQAVTDGELEAARAGRVELRHELTLQMGVAGIDLWIAPSSTGPAPEGLESTGDPTMNLPWTQAGLPAVTLPMPIEDGDLPMGLQLVGRFGEDENLLAWSVWIAHEPRARGDERADMTARGASVLRHELRPGAYCDSIVLLKLQKSLAALAGVEDASAVMATDTNLALLAANGLAPAGLADLASDDLLVVVRAESEVAGDAALAQLDALLSARAAGVDADEDYRPKSLASALKALPEARWVLVSVPGRFAARVAREALERGRHVFLFSDNVPLEEEAALKLEAAERGLLVLGPDCGTAIVAGVGLGFANRVRRGGVGLVAASGTGLQAVASRLHALGAGVSHALGTGGRNLSDEIRGIAARQSLDLLARDPSTRVIVLISKPPSPSVTPSLLAAARATGKPVVVCLLGYSPPVRQMGDLYFSLNLTEAAELAARLDAETSLAPGSTTVTAAGGAGQGLPHGAEPPRRAPGGKDRRQDPRPSGEPPSEGSASLPGPFLRGLFSGGTLAYEALLGLAPYLGPIHSNLHADLALPLTDLHRSQGHTLLDLGDDAFTVGRLHPMIDQDLRLRRFRQEAADPEVGVILLDLVLGDAGHPEPAGEWVPVIAEAKAARPIEVVAMVVGTDDDPQSLTAQAGALRSAGATVFDDPSAAIAYAGARLAGAVSPPPLPEVAAEALGGPLAAVNVGLESFHASLSAQGAAVLQVEWRPPAGGDPRLLAILDRLRR